MTSQQKKSLQFKLANKIASDTYNEAVRQGVAGNLRKSDFTKYAFAEAAAIIKGYPEDIDKQAFSSAIIEPKDLFVVPYSKFRGTELVIHPGSTTWWMRNKIGTLRGSTGGKADDVDLKKYKEFVNGYYEDRSGNIIEQITKDMLEEALYTHDHGIWNGIKTFKTGRAGNKSDAVYIHSYKDWTRVFIYPLIYESMKSYINKYRQEITTILNEFK